MKELERAGLLLQPGSYDRDSFYLRIFFLVRLRQEVQADCSLINLMLS